MTQKKFSQATLLIGLVFLFIGALQVLLRINYTDGQPLFVYAGAILTFAGLISTLLNRNKSN